MDASAAELMVLFMNLVLLVFIFRWWFISRMNKPDMSEVAAHSFRTTPMEDPNLHIDSGKKAGASPSSLSKSESRRKEVEKEAIATPTVQIEPWVTGLPDIVGREDTVSEILRHLYDAAVGMVWICGPAGVGKTTLLGLIHENFRARGGVTCDFDAVACVTLSRWSTAMDAQRQIGDRLGLRLWSDGPDFVRETQARSLHRLLSRRRFLLLVDEAPEGTRDVEFLREVGIPLPDSSNKSKMVWTTTSSSGIHRDMGSVCRVVLLSGLDEEDALRLLLSDAGAPEYQALQEHRVLLESITKRCHGLPLALIIVGRLIGKFRTWIRRDADEALVRTFDSLSNNEGARDQVLRQVLIYQYQRLTDDDERFLLLYCSLFPENRSISVETLQDYRNGECDTDPNKFHLALRRLKSAGLLDIQDLKLHGSVVKLHEAVREMALGVAGGFNLVHAGEGLSVLPQTVGMNSQRATRISLMYNNIQVLSDTAGSTSTFPELLTLLLNMNPLKGIPRDFFRCMPALRVLDLSWTQIEELPPTVGSLYELRYLNLSHTWIRSLPEELRDLQNLTSLNLSYTDHLCRIPRVAISGLSKLQRLNLFNTAHQWPEESDGVDQSAHLWPKEGVRSMPFGKRRKRFHTAYPWPKEGFHGSLHASDDLQALRWPKETGDHGLTKCLAEDFLVADPMGANLHDLEYLGELQEIGLTVKSLSTLKRLGSLKNLSGSTAFLSLDQIEGLTAFHVSYLFSTQNFRALRELRINDASQLEELDFHGIFFWDLRAISLEHLPRAKVAFRCFQGLRRLHIIGCHALVHLQGVSVLRLLESLELRICHGIQQLSPPGDDGINVSLPGLQRMVLWGLPRLKFITVRPLRLRSLRYLEVYHCPELKKLPFDDMSAQDIEEIRGSHEWWDGLEWDDPNIKSAFYPRFTDPQRLTEELEEETDEEYI